MIRLLAAIVLLSALAGCGDAVPVAADNSAAPKAATPRAPEPLPDIVRVRLETEAGAIVVALDHRRAPVTTENFVRYAEEGRFDGTTFYRAAKTPRAEGRGFIQGGIRRDYRRMLPPIAHEPTSRTGIRHQAGTISMAHAEGGAGAIGDFFITASIMPAMDAHGDEEGYAAFGRVVEGMDVVRRILAAPTLANSGRGAMRGQWLAAPVRIVRARRVD
ncbi:MAG: peptidyl-prolyl cis-trans isomerase [Sphingomonadales bacterium]|nr:peptidyl-prolyl cis-trans isomerase [Sphingomonadales bacterium]